MNRFKTEELRAVIEELDYYEQRRATRRFIKKLVGVLLARASVELGISISYIDKPRTENASACLCSTASLHIDIGWLVAMRELYGLAVVYAIVLHEIGHLLDCRRNRGDHNRELYADRVSGYLMALFGFGWQGVAEYYLYEADCGPHCGNVCTTHPPAQPRYAAWTAGYESGTEEGQRRTRVHALRNWIKENPYTPATRYKPATRNQ